MWKATKKDTQHLTQRMSTKRHDDISGGITPSIGHKSAVEELQDSSANGCRLLSGQIPCDSPTNKWGLTWTSFCTDLPSHFHWHRLTSFCPGWYFSPPACECWLRLYEMRMCESVMFMFVKEAASRIRGYN